MDATATPRTRRLGRWIVGSGICLSSVVAICIGMWYWLPYFAPDLVMRHSPWLEPVVRTRMYFAAIFNGGIDHTMANPDPRLYEDRIDSWGPDLFKDLAPLLHSSPAMREAALETYPLRAPLAERPRYIREPKLWERIVLNVKPIFDVDRVWFIARVNNRSFDLENPRSVGINEIRDLFNHARLSVDSIAHPSIPGRAILPITIELRVDFHVPFWLVDRLIKAVNERSSKPGEQDFAYLYATTSYGGSRAECSLSTTSLPTPPEAHVITLLPRSTPDDDAGVDVLVDAQPAIIVAGPPNSRIRHDGIVRAIDHGLSVASPRRNAICVRGGPLTPWGDVVAGLDGARIANDMTGDEWKTEGSNDPTARKSLTIGPMFTGIPNGKPVADEPPSQAQPPLGVP